MQIDHFTQNSVDPSSQLAQALQDRQLLETVAKFVGYTTDHPWNKSRLELDPPVLSLVTRKDGAIYDTGWNPLKNNGDAFSLATMLRIDTHHEDAFFEAGFRGTWLAKEAIESQDVSAAARRAIVMAAVEMCKQNLSVHIEGTEAAFV